MSAPSPRLSLAVTPKVQYPYCRASGKTQVGRPNSCGGQSIHIN